MFRSIELLESRMLLSAVPYDPANVQALVADSRALRHGVAACAASTATISRELRAELRKAGRTPADAALLATLHSDARTCSRTAANDVKNLFRTTAAVERKLIKDGRQAASLAEADFQQFQTQEPAIESAVAADVSACASGVNRDLDGIAARHPDDASLAALATAGKAATSGCAVQLQSSTHSVLSDILVLMHDIVVTLGGT